MCQPWKTSACALHSLDCLQMFGVGAAGELAFKFRNKSRGWPRAARGGHAMHSMSVPNIRSRNPNEVFRIRKKIKEHSILFLHSV